MTPKQLNKNPVRPIIKVKPHQKLVIDERESAKDEGESTASKELPEDSIPDIHIGTTEDSKHIETPQVPTVTIKSTHDEVDPSEDKSMTEFELPKENGEQKIVKDNKLLYTNSTVEIQNRKVEGLITYSLDQQIFNSSQFWKQRIPRNL